MWQPRTLGCAGYFANVCRNQSFRADDLRFDHRGAAVVEQDETHAAVLERIVDAVVAKNRSVRSLVIRMAFLLHRLVVARRWIQRSLE